MLVGNLWSSGYSGCFILDVRRVNLHGHLFGVRRVKYMKSE